jgi:hypothetical protein
VLADGHRRTLVSGLPSLEVARELEHGIEQALGLPDRSVPGEAQAP